MPGRTLLPALGVSLLLAAPVLAQVSGVVVDKEGAPIEGVSIRLVRLETAAQIAQRLLSETPDPATIATSATPKEGTFRFEKIGHATAMLVFARSGHQLITRMVAEGDDLGAVLLKEGKAARLRVTAEGKPVAGAVVSLSPYAVFRTNAEGVAEVPKPEFLSGHATVIARGYAPAPLLALRSESVALERGVVVRGTVTRPDGRTPAAAAAITADGWPVGTTGEDGSFTATVPAAWQRITATSGALIATVQKSSGPLAIRLQPGSTVKGTVVDEASRRPVAGMLVRLASGESITDGSGSFAIGPLVPGTYRPHGRHARYELVEDPPDLELSPGASTAKLSAVEAISISGTVIDEAKKVLGGVVLQRAASVPETTVTLRDGSFRMRLQRLGSDVVFSRQGYAPLPLSVPASSKSGLTLTLRKGVVATFQVKDRAGAAIEGVFVRVRTPRGNAQQHDIRCDSNEECATEADGAVRVTLAPGRYDVMVTGKDVVRKSFASIEVSAAASTIPLTVERGVSIVGRVEYADGSIPVGRVEARSEEKGSMPVAVTIGDDGTFVLSGVPRVPLTVTAHVSEPVTGTSVSKEITPPAENVVFTIPSGGIVTGRVVEAGTGRSIVDYSLVLARPEDRFPNRGRDEVIKPTGSDGSFRIEHVPPGSFEVIASAPGYATGTTTGIEVTDGETTSGVEVHLERAAVVRGRVTETNGAPIAGAAVRMVQQGGRRGMYSLERGSAATDANGEYELQSVPPGARDLSFWKRGYAVVLKRVEATVDRAATLDVVLDRGRELRGRVVDEAGRPVGGASVVVTSERGQNVRSESDGTFTVLVSGPKSSLMASKSGYVSARKEIDASTTDVTLALGRGTSIRGRIVGLTEGELAATTVHAWGSGSGSEARPDSRGEFTLTGVSEGRVTVEARLNVTPPPRRTRKTIDIGSGDNPVVELEFTGSITVRGRVNTHGRSIPELRVHFNPASGDQPSGHGDVKGDSYVITGLAAGTYRVSAEAGMFEVYRANVELSTDMTHDIELDTGAIRGRVVDEKGLPVPAARIVARQVKPGSNGMITPRFVTSDSTGRFVLNFLPPGEWVLQAEKERYQTATMTIDAGAMAGEVELRMKLGMPATVRVFDARTGGPVAARVTTGNNAGSYAASTGEGGVAELWLPPGEHEVRVTASKYAPSTARVTVPGAETRVGLSVGGSFVFGVNEADRSANVRVTGPSFRTAVPAANGRVDYVPAGTYTLELRRGQTLIASKQATVGEGQTVTVTFE